MIDENYCSKIEFSGFLVKREVLGSFFAIKNILRNEKEDILFGIAFIKSGYVLPGLRILYRASTVEDLKKVLSEVVFLPSDIANIFFQTISLNDLKLIKFVRSLNLYKEDFSLKLLEGLGVREIVVNGIPDDLVATKSITSISEPSINYYVDDDGRFIVIVNGIKFYLPSKVGEFVEEGGFSIGLKSVFNFGFPDERVFFTVKKSISPEEITPYFDPMIKIDSLISKIESGKFIDFFYEFIYLLSYNFELINKGNVKRIIIDHLKHKNMLWLLVEIKNIVSFLYTQDPSTELRSINKNIEIFFDDWEFDLIFRSNKIKVITPIVDQDKYLGDSKDYLLNSRRNDIILVTEGNDIKVVFKDNGIIVGRINPNTSRLISELEGNMLSCSLVVPKFVEFYTGIPFKFDLWVEINLVRV